MRIERDQDGVPKIGGFLALVALSTFLTPAFFAWDILTLVKQFSPEFPANLQSFYLGAIAIEAGFLVFWIISIVKLNAKDPAFPKLFIWLSLAALIYQIGMLIIVSAQFNVKLTVDDQRDAIRSFINCAIWIPYMLLSKRVKTTFYGQTFIEEETVPAGSPPAPVFSALKSSPTLVTTTDPEALRLKRKGHRLGVLITALSAILFLAGALGSTGYSTPAWASLFVAVGGTGVLVGYVIARLWYWYRAA